MQNPGCEGAVDIKEGSFTWDNRENVYFKKQNMYVKKMFIFHHNVQVRCCQGAQQINTVWPQLS